MTETTPSLSLIAQRRGGKIVYEDISYILLQCCRNHIFYLTFTQFLNDEWCNRCYKSEGETKIRIYLKSLNILFHQERTFPIELYYQQPLRLDFYLPSIRLVIEYDGKCHFYPKSIYSYRKFRDQLKRDQIKNEWCRNTYRSILRIPFWHSSMLQTMILSAIQSINNGILVHIDEAESWRLACIESLNKGKSPIPPPVEE